MTDLRLKTFTSTQKQQVLNTSTIPAHEKHNQLAPGYQPNANQQNIHSHNRSSFIENPEDRQRRINCKIQKKIIARKTEIQTMSQNSCSFISSFDLLKDTNWLQLVKIWNGSRPTIIPLLHSNNYSKAKLADALQPLNLDSLNTTKLALQIIQDPWIIIESIRMTFLSLDNMTNILPITKLEKCNNTCLFVVGDISYTAHKNKFIIQEQNCVKCLQKNSPISVFTPKELLCQIKGKQKQYLYGKPSALYSELQTQIIFAIQQFDNSLQNNKIRSRTDWCGGPSTA